jgi:pimeloyl-ACP methyl ester carboxylesterase
MTLPQMCFREQGAGLPLVLIHGFPFDSHMWDDQLAALSRGYRVILPDLPGFGLSQPPRPFTVPLRADELHALLAGIGALPCILGGLSMGGYICFEFAARYLTDLRALLLLDTRCEADTPEARENRNKMIHTALTQGPKPIADAMEPKMLAPSAPEPVRLRLRQMMDAVPAQTIAHCLTAARDRLDSSQRLGDIRVPTLVVVGEHDTVTPPAVAQAMQQGIPNARLATIPGAGHMPPIEQAQEFNRKVLEFLATL